jgi:hypothetical protein
VLFLLLKGGEGVIRVKRNVWKTVALVILTITSIAACYPSMDGPNINPAAGGGLAHQSAEKYFDIFSGPFLEIQAEARGNRASLYELSGSASGVERRMNKDARNTMGSIQRNTWKTYMAQYSASISAGGKNSIISSADILEEWRAAIRSVCYS